MSSASSSGSWPAGLSLTGGIPTKSQDLAASIIFTIAFFLLLPLAGWRWFSRPSRTLTLIRPSVVLVLRIATYSIRAVQANGNYSKGLFITEQVFLLAGLIPLLEPVVVLLRAHVRRDWIPEPPAHEGEEQKRVTTLSRALRALQLAVFVAFILGIVAGSKAGSAMGDPDAAAELKRYRYASIGLSLFIIGLSFLVACAMHIRDSLPTRGTAFILALCIILAMPNIYKLVVSIHHVAMLSAGAKTAFYLLSCLPEWIVIVAYFSVNLNMTFELEEASWKDKVERKMKKGEWPTGMGYIEKEAYERRRNEDELEMSISPQSKV
ncbi:hypothetical protein JCM11641_008008 [Rhodosporidiobolus odoratus]